MAVSLSTINAERIADINKEIAKLISKGASSTSKVDVNGVNVDMEDKNKYQALIALRTLLSKEPAGKEVYNFGEIAYLAEDDVQIFALYHSGATGLEMPKCFERRGFIPGLAIPTPLPKQIGESYTEYEAYLKQYYAAHNVQVSVGENGLREPYPHEKYKWVDGRASIPSPEEKYVDPYYKEYCDAIQMGNMFNQAMNRRRRRSDAHTNPVPGEATPTRTAAPAGSPASAPAPGTPAPGSGTPNQARRRRAPSGQVHFTRRKLKRAPEDKHGFFDRIFGAVYDFNQAAVSPAAYKNYKKILKVIGLVLGGIAILGLAYHAVIPFLGIIVDSFAKGIAIGNAGTIGTMIAKIVAIGLGATLVGFFAKYVHNRKKKDSEDEAAVPGGSNPPEGPEPPTFDPNTITDPAQLVAYIKQQMAKFNAELQALDAEEMNLKNPGPISPADQDRINKKRAIIQEGRNKLMDILMTYRTNVDINQERVMGGR